MERKINKLKKRIREAHEAGRYATEARLMAELLALEDSLSAVTENITLSEAAGGDKGLRDSLSMKLVETNVYADLLYACAMEFQSMLPGCIVSMPYIGEVRRLVKQAHDVVASIDRVGDARLSEHYAAMTEEVEQKVTYYVRNTVANILNRRIGFK